MSKETGKYLWAWEGSPQPKNQLLYSNFKLKN